MSAWACWFSVWSAVGLLLLSFIGRGIQKQCTLPRFAFVAIPVWILFSSVAAEITRLYLTVVPVPISTSAIAVLGIALLGAGIGSGAGWFMGASGIGYASDAAAGMLGALIAAWAEITSSYNHADYVLAIVAVGASFAVFVLRLSFRQRIYGR